MKKIYLFLSILVSVVISLFIIYYRNTNTKYIEYNGYKLMLSVDGVTVDKLPSGNYFLVDYSCSSAGSKITWDRENKLLTFDNYDINDTCYLEFESTPKLYDLVNIGDYIEYTGNNGCNENLCKGWNANQTNVDMYDNYGYCYSSNFKFYVYGWRVLYKENNQVFIVSAGSPECVAGIEDDSKETKSNINTASLKYCNTSYISDGICDINTIHAFNGYDFYQFTGQYYGSNNARYLDSYNDGGTYGNPYCRDLLSNKYCGYHNDIIDNGGYYWFANSANLTHTNYWSTSYHRVHINNTTRTNGIRPVLKLDSSILATGGSGIMTDPYKISERS